MIALPNDILALQEAPGLSENDDASIDHLPGSKSLKMRVCHWGTAPNQFAEMHNSHDLFSKSKQ